MKVLILGGAGMLGHKLWQVFSTRFNTYATVRQPLATYARYGIFDPERLRGGVDAFQFDSIVHAVADLKPDVVINCIGIIKQKAEAYDKVYALTINAILPHKLKNLCQVAGARLIQMSTDCVFSGRRGMYTEDDESDATDLYGRSKFLGEVTGDGCLTIRTSLIGRELSTSYGLVEWFLSSVGQTVKGYTNAIFSGFPTLVLAEIMANIIENLPSLSGVWQVSSDPISKYELLRLIRAAYNLDIEIEPYGAFRADRSLDSARFRAATGFSPASWSEMVQRMAEDPTPYNQWRGKQ